MDEKELTELKDIFSRYSPYYKVDQYSIVTVNFESLVSNFQKLPDISDDLVTKITEKYKKLKNDSRNIYKFILLLLTKNYTKEALEYIGKLCYKAKPLNLYAITPLMNEQEIENHRHFIALKSENIFKCGKSENFMCIIDEIVSLMHYMLKYDDTTIFNGVIVWLNTFITQNDVQLYTLISEYHSNYYETVNTFMKLPMGFFHKQINEQINKNTFDEKVFIIDNETLLYKGVKKDSMERLTREEPTYFLAFNPIQSFLYSNLENDSIGGQVDLKVYCETVGYIGVFKPKKKLKFIVINNYENMKMIYDIAKKENNPTLLKALKKSYPIDEENKTVSRDSINGYDKIVSAFLCNNIKGYDGYVAKSFEKFSPELMVCNSNLVQNIHITESKNLLYYCRGTSYDFQTIVIDSTNVDDDNDIVDVDKINYKDLIKFDDCELQKFIKEKKLINYGDRNRNIYNIYMKTNILNKMSDEDLKNMYTQLLTSIGDDSSVNDILDRRPIKKKVTDSLRIYYLSEMNKYIKK